MFPNFICPGAQKAGTTRLYSLLRQHPDIGMPDVKEPGFFSLDRRYEQGMEWYRKQYFQSTGSRRIVADMSTAYLSHAEVVAPRIMESLGPSVRFVVVLRNPAERAYSHYLMNVRDCIEEKTFEQAIEWNLSGDAHGTMPKNGKPWEYAYVRNGMYAMHIKEFLKCYDRENFKFILFEEFRQDEKSCVEEIFDFLGINRDAQINYDTILMWKNPAAKAKSKTIQVYLINKFLKTDNLLKRALRLVVPRKFGWAVNKKIMTLNRRPYDPPKMKAETRKMLLEIFRSDIAQLEQIIQKDLSSWLA